MNLSLVNNAGLVAARVLLAYIFIISGYAKIGGFAGTQAYMSKFGVPGSLLPVVIAAEIGLGLLVALGYQTRLAALGLAGFTLISGLIFHYQPADQMQMIQFMKNLAITGGFLALASSGAGQWSLDAVLGRKTAPGGLAAA